MQNRRYHQVVFIKDTNPDNGPGHASTSVIKSSEGTNKSNHTSFCPTVFGSVFNALTLGSVPVPGRLDPDHSNDLNEANHILVKEINDNEYKQARQAQREFSQKVHEREHLYSVFGGMNPLALFSNMIFNAANHANATQRQHVKTEGFYPPEDHTGIPVFSNHHHAFAKESKIHNCVSSTRDILHAANVSIEDPVLPTEFTHSLLNHHGFQKIDREEFDRRFRF